MDYYEILGISSKSNYDEIRKAYHKMALKTHPDKCNDTDAEQKFRNVVEAYEILSDPVKRRRYDLSRKLNDAYDFQLPPDILRFSRYFFSDKNIKKFHNMGNIISQQAENFGININFDIMLHSFLGNIRNGKYFSLLEEYQMFRKFYDSENKFESPAEERYKKSQKKKQEYEYEKRKEQKEKNISTLSKLPKTKFNNRCVTVNVKVNLENMYNRNIKVANIKVDTKCPKCQGTGIVDIENPKKYKNSKSKYRKRNLSRKKNDSFLDKKICVYCQGTTKISEEKKYLIDTSLDKICYLNEYFINLEEGYYDLIFSLQLKKHSLYYVNEDNRYDINLDKFISLSAYYYGGNLKVPFLDGSNLDIKWQGFNNGKFQNMLVIKNKGLIMIEDNNYIVSDGSLLVNNFKIDSCQRGDLKVNLFIKIPIYQELQLDENKEIIEKLVVSDSEK